MLNFRSLLRFLLVTILLAPALPADAARTLGDAGVAYRADRVLTVGAQSFPGTLVAIPGYQRHEQMIGGIEQVAIFDFSTARGYFIIPAVTAYLDFPIGPALHELSDPSVIGAPEGHADVNGVATTKYRVAHAAPDGTRIEGHVWLTAEGIPMRGDGAVIETNGKTTPISWELSNLQKGPQDPKLFQPPVGYLRLPASALPGFFGGSAH
jgi:hypothetical protein